MSLVTGADMPAEPAGEGNAMEPDRVNRRMDAVLAADDGYLEAVRKEFRQHDIIEVFGGYLAVPAGTVIVQSSTLGGLAAKLRRLPEQDR